MDVTRSLTESEIDQLKLNGNTAENWQNIKVTEPFNPDRIRNSSFYGSIYFGGSELNEIKGIDLILPVGIYNSTLRNTIVDNDCAIHSVKYISDYHIKERTILFDVGTLTAQKTPIELPPIEVGNENGKRSFYPHQEMSILEVYLCCKIDLNIDVSQSESIEYTIGPDTFLLSTKTVINSIFGENVVIRGADLVENCIIIGGNSRSRVGHGVILKNGIIHEGSSAEDGVTAESFIFFPFSHLSHRARIAHSVLGSNSHISGGEIQNSLLFPFHEQHHNSSFLCSSIIMGQTNIAAGAVIGSNHNSRRADGELAAGRGFWPGLTSNVSFPSRFASFAIIKNGRYSHTLNIIFPFSLITKFENKTAIIPAYWLMYNLYALFRNQYKFKKREMRPGITSEYHFLDIDTVYEIVHAITVLKSIFEKHGRSDNPIILSPREFKFSDNPIVLLKSSSAFRIYTDLCELFCVLNLIQRSMADISTASDDPSRWMILDQYRFTMNDLLKIKHTIEKQNIHSWSTVHCLIEEESRKSAVKITKFALNTFQKLHRKPGESTIKEQILECRERVISTCDLLYNGVCESRIKDFKNPLREITFDNPDEKDRIYGSYPDPVIDYAKAETERMKNLIKDYA